MTPAALRAYCLGKAATREEFPFGPEVSVFKVAGKMYAVSQLDEQPLRVSLKCDPDLAEALRKQYCSIQPGYHLNKRHWNTIVLDGAIITREIKAMIDDSYDLVVAGLPRALRDTLLRGTRSA